MAGVQKMQEHFSALALNGSAYPCPIAQLWLW